MGIDCDKFPFDYNKHITLKNVVSSEYRYFVRSNNVFQGISVHRCDHCLVEGFNSFTIPFQFETSSPDEIHCTLKRMGLIEISPIEASILPELENIESGLLCGTCIELLEIEEI